ncbi:MULTISPECIES: hypothetical protein [Streptomyces]|uniref:Uncharacterized protein n=1 Tax=Streptomyces yunnanensis TaxID=156453 RepID=A0ABY8A9F6_9ACTN|nr:MULTISPECIES: hypothetical protein [Streptomyces]WEB40829.1 hypothetical protein MOV08_17115 [Streptomyces yunnanensis]
MSLLFFGKDPDTDEDHCPSVWVDEKQADLLLQGWKADEATEDECRKYGSIPDTEALIRIPARMVPQIRKACDAAERAASEADSSELR